MSGSYTGGRYGTARGRNRRTAPNLWETVNRVRDAFEQRDDAMRAGSDELRDEVLSILVDGPMHGSQVLRAVEARGMRDAGPAAVYPLLQLLADEGLVAAEEADGRKSYSLTVSGRAAAEAVRDRPTMRDDRMRGDRRGSLPRAGARLAQAAAAVAQSGTPSQVDEAVAALDEARRTLYTILSRP